MCSNADAENDGVILMEEIDNSDIISTKCCRKCPGKTVASVVLRKKDAYCKMCFLSSVSHKFRACLGKSKVMRPGDKVLVAYSGNSNSVALLHLMQAGLQDTSHKRLMCEPFVVYIDESSILNLKEGEKNNILESISQALQAFNYPRYKVPLELCFQSEEALDKYLKSCDKKDGKEPLADFDKTTIKQLFDNMSEITAKVDLLNKLRHNLLVQVAKCLGCGKVFTAESADDLAVKLLTNVSLGRGAQLPFDVGFSDDRSPDGQVIRPLRDLSKKELALYNVFQKLSSIHVPSLTTKTDTHSSIQKLTESFLCNLQDGFPSTLSTVFRVADKLTTPSGEKQTCLLCQAPHDTEDVSSSSLSATQFSGLLSSLGPSNFDAFKLEEHCSSSSSKCYGANDGLTEKSCCGGGPGSSKDSNQELKDMLCYGCSLILKSADTLPPQFLKLLQDSRLRFRIKKEIEDFLL